MGIKNNDYYKESMNLQIELAEQYRNMGQIKMHQLYIKDCEKVQDKLSKKMKTPISMSAFHREKAYAKYYLGEYE